MSNRILIIEDDASMRESLQELFSMEHYECDMAETGTEGLEKFEERQPQLVVMDVQLPDVSGFQLCQILKKDPSTQRMPVVMVSGRFTEPQDKVQCLELGADDFFMKP